jgi:hypothetical protein
MPRAKNYYRKEDGIDYKICIGCQNELPLAAFSHSGKPGADGVSQYYEARCKPCKSKYSRQYRINYEKASRRKIVRLEETVDELRAEIEGWKALFDFARAHPLAQGFKTPQDFILATLKTTYDNGRQKTG